MTVPTLLTGADADHLRATRRVEAHLSLVDQRRTPSSASTTVIGVHPRQPRGSASTGRPRRLVHRRVNSADPPLLGVTPKRLFRPLRTEWHGDEQHRGITMTSVPPPYSGPDLAGPPLAGWPPPSQQPQLDVPSGRSPRRSVRPVAVAITVLSVALVIVTTLWLVAASDLRAIQAARDAVPDLKAVAEASFGSSAPFYGDAESVTVILTDGNAETTSPGLRKMLDQLGFSDAVINRMGQTRAIDGTQSAEGTHCNVTWTYHPDDDLQAVFEADGQ